MNKGRKQQTIPELQKKILQEIHDQFSLEIPDWTIDILLMEIDKKLNRFAKHLGRTRNKSLWLKSR